MVALGSGRGFREGVPQTKMGRAHWQRWRKDIGGTSKGRLQRL